ncbi:MAG: hypothetical protein K2Y03_11025 [Sphingomonas sp.]|nr:hypothetical protein [Sphingomonas sp.]
MRFDSAEATPVPGLAILLAAAAARAASSPTARLAAGASAKPASDLLQARRGAFNTAAAQSLTGWQEA